VAPKFLLQRIERVRVEPDGVTDTQYLYRAFAHDLAQLPHGHPVMRRDLLKRQRWVALCQSQLSHQMASTGFISKSIAIQGCPSRRVLPSAPPG
jgi:hypothetical protein